MVRRAPSWHLRRQDSSISESKEKMGFFLLKGRGLEIVGQGGFLTQAEGFLLTHGADSKAIVAFPWHDMGDTAGISAPGPANME